MNVERSRVPEETAEPASQPVVVCERDDDETVTSTITRALSSALDVPQTEMVPLYEVVETDALDTLFPPGGRVTSSDADARVVFEYDGHRVRVEGDGRVSVY